MASVRWREPDELAQGDTLSFVRSLNDYPASEGWSLVYEMRGQGQPIEFTSTAQNNSHLVNVAAAVTALWLPGDYLLVGYAVNAGQRFQIYEGPLALKQNLQGAAGTVEVKTFAQEMVELYQTAIKAKAGDDLAASQIEGTRFQFLTPEQMRTELAYWSEVRRNEVAKERVRDGKANDYKIRTRMNVANSGAILGSGVYPYNQ